MHLPRHVARTSSKSLHLPYPTPHSSCSSKFLHTIRLLSKPGQLRTALPLTLLSLAAVPCAQPHCLPHLAPPWRSDAKKCYHVTKFLLCGVPRAPALGRRGTAPWSPSAKAPVLAFLRPDPNLHPWAAQYNTLGLALLCPPRNPITYPLLCPVLSPSPRPPPPLRRSPPGTPAARAPARPASTQSGLAPEACPEHIRQTHVKIQSPRHRQYLQS